MEIIIALAAVFVAAGLVNKRKRRFSIPICYHCESKDTLKYHKVFFCGFCSKVLDENHIMRNYRQDAEFLINRTANEYELFKKTRQNFLKNGYGMEK